MTTKITDSSNNTTPKREQTLIRDLAKRWSSGAPGAGPIRVGNVGQNRKRGHLMATISVAGAQSDFYDPLYALAKMMDDARDPAKQPLPVRKLDPKTIVSTALVDAPRANYAHWQTQRRRMCKIAGSFLRAWEAGPVPHGRLYLFHDKVLYQAFNAASGWINLRVPEEGMNWTPEKPNSTPERKTCSTPNG